MPEKTNVIITRCEHCGNLVMINKSELVNLMSEQAEVLVDTGKKLAIEPRTAKGSLD